MPLKKYTKFLSSEACSFCRLSESDILYGPIYKCKQKFQKKYIMVHYYCLLMASKIEQNGRDTQGILGFFPKDIIKELTRGLPQACCYCNCFGATVHCIHKDCDRVFHFPCGIKKGSIHQFFDLFNSYCHVHKPKQTIPAPIFRHIEDTCVICSNNTDKRNRYDCLWPICCKPKILIHRRCIQTMACNAGYYFKCPLCNNVDIFKKEMQRIGIYVPEQDASWELEPHAYEELRVRGSGCESEECVCPKGRNFTHKNSAWHLELCQVCGGNGVHLGCSKKWDKNSGFKFNWFCKICKPVYLENKASRTPEHYSAQVEPVTTREENVFTPDASSQDSQSSIDVLGHSIFGNLMRDSVLMSEVTEEGESKDKTEGGDDDDDDDDVVIVVSEGEEESEVAASAPSPPPHQPDDGVVAMKRRNVEAPLSPRKKLRTAPWAPVDNAVRKNDVRSGLLEKIQQITQGVYEPHKTPTPPNSTSKPCSGRNVYNDSLPGPSTCTYTQVPLVPQFGEDVVNSVNSEDSMLESLLTSRGISKKVSLANKKRAISISNQPEDFYRCGEKKKCNFELGQECEEDEGVASEDVTGRMTNVTSKMFVQSDNYFKNPFQILKSTSNMIAAVKQMFFR